MTYIDSKCIANCGFCPQAKDSQSKTELLSRVSWPAFSSSRVISKITNSAKAGKIKRVCIQAINYANVFEDLCGFAKALKTQTSIPLSVSCQPLVAENMWRLAQVGTERIGIALDASTKQLFDRVKGEETGGPYKWEQELVLLRTAVGVFGEGKVSTHIIIGLGETEKEAAYLIQKCVDMGILPALFAFTPVKGTALAEKPKPKIEEYRRVQLARYLLVNALSRFEDMRFNDEGHTTNFGTGKDVLFRAVGSGKPFETSGCPDCNRPFYNESPRGPIYNYPRQLIPQETTAIMEQLSRFLK